MKKQLLYLIFSFFLITSIVAYNTVYNPFTSKMDYVNWLGNIVPNAILNDTLEVNTILFNTTFVPLSHQAGQVHWNSEDGTLDYDSQYNGTHIQIGQEEVVKVVNKAGRTLTSGDVVYISGAQGQRPKVELANVSSEIASDKVLGVVTMNISINQEGLVTTFGLVRDFDTSKFTAGDVLYLDIGGNLTNIESNAPNHRTVIGIVTQAHGVQGTIFVNVVNGFETTELHDVNSTEANADGQILVWDNTTKIWQVGTRVQNNTGDYNLGIKSLYSNTFDDWVGSTTIQVLSPMMMNDSLMTGDNYPDLYMTQNNYLAEGIDKSQYVDLYPSSLHLWEKINDTAESLNSCYYASTGITCTNGSTVNEIFYMKVDGFRYNEEEVLTQAQNKLVKEPTGFRDRTTTSIEFRNSDRNFTISPSGGSTFDYYINGTKCTSGPASVVIPAAVGMNYIYFTDCNTLRQSTTAWGFEGYAQVATIYWDAVQGVIGDERHGLAMDWATHEFIHDTIGTRYESGLTGQFSSTGFNLTSGAIDDEDLEFTIGAQNLTHVFFRQGSQWSWLVNKTIYYYSNASTLYYDNSGTLTALTSNQYMAVWVFATNSPRRPIITILGQRVDTTLANAQANNKYESLAFGTLPFAEMKLLYRVILRQVASPYIETQDLRSISNVPAGTYTATAHNVLTGLTTGDDHTQYVLDAGDTMTGQFNVTGSINMNGSSVIYFNNSVCPKTYMNASGCLIQEACSGSRIATC